MYVYISGKIGERVISEATRKKFERAQKMLLGLGHKVMDPASEIYQKSMLKEVAIEEKKWSQVSDIEFNWQAWVLLWDLHNVALADAVYMLEDWHDSPGATAEYYFAIASGKKIFFQSKQDAFMKAGEKMNSMASELNKKSQDEQLDIYTKEVNKIWLPIE